MSHKKLIALFAAGALSLSGGGVAYAGGGRCERDGDGSGTYPGETAESTTNESAATDGSTGTTATAAQNRRARARAARAAQS